MGCSSTFVAVWNLLTASLQWALDVPTSALATDPVHPFFSIAVPTTSPLKGGVPVSLHDEESARAAHAGATGEDGSAEEATRSHDGNDLGPGGGRSEPGSGRFTSSQKWQPPLMHNSHILVFDPRSPSPRFHCICPGTQSPTLLYVPPGMPQHSSETAGANGFGISPLIVLSENRAYTYITTQGKRNESNVS